MPTRALMVDAPYVPCPRQTAIPIGRPGWWQWPTVLSLDAPVVAVLWQWLLARAAHARLEWPPPLVLGGSVWLAYTADRWIEGWRVAPVEVKTQRHHFAQRHRWPVATLWSIVFVGDVSIAVTQLTAYELASGLGLLVMVLTYLLSHQLIHRDHPWRAPKEVCVAVLLTGGVLLFSAARGEAGTLAAPLALFGMLCFGNCVLISAWERDVDATHGETSFALQFRFGRALSRWWPWMVATLAAGVVCLTRGPARDAAGCAFASGLLLGSVDVMEYYVGREVARVLADVVLMTPLLFWLHWS